MKKALAVALITGLIGLGLGTWGASYVLEPLIERQAVLIREQGETIESLEDKIEQLRKEAPNNTPYIPESTTITS